MEKFRLILHGALNGTAEGRLDLIDRLESGLGLSRETAEILMSDLPRVIREDLTESEASDLSFELEALGALVETEAHPESSTGEESTPEPESAEMGLDEGMPESSPIFQMSDSELPTDIVDSLLNDVKLSTEENSTVELSIDEHPEAQVFVEPEPPVKRQQTLAQSIHADLSSLDLSGTTSPMEIGFDTESTAEEENTRVVGFFDEPAPTPVPSPQVAQSPAPDMIDDAFRMPLPRVAEAEPNPIYVLEPEVKPNKYLPLIIGGAILAVISLGGFYAFNQPESGKEIKVSGNIGALIKDQEKILESDSSIKIPTVKTLRSWTRDFIQEEYQGKLTVDELQDGKARVRIKLKFLKPKRPSKEDLALGRGRSEWMTTAEGEIEATPALDGFLIRLPIDGQLKAYLQGINTSSRKPVELAGSVTVDSKSSNITAKLELNIKLKNLSPIAKTTQEPFTDQTQLLDIP